LDRTTGRPDTSRRETARTGLGPSPRVVNVRGRARGWSTREANRWCPHTKRETAGTKYGAWSQSQRQRGGAEGGRLIGEAKVGGCAPRGRRAKGKHGDKSIAPPARKEEPKGWPIEGVAANLMRREADGQDRPVPASPGPQRAMGGLDTERGGCKQLWHAERRTRPGEGLDLEAVRPRDRERGYRQPLHTKREASWARAGPKHTESSVTWEEPGNHVGQSWTPKMGTRIRASRTAHSRTKAELSQKPSRSVNKIGQKYKLDESSNSEQTRQLGARCPS
jgi:hypothetical protein